MLKEIIKKYADYYKLGSELVAAVIAQESSGDSFAFRYEPAFFRRYIKNKSQKELGGFWLQTESKNDEMLERYHRSCSWGLMQIMGQTAREMGFVGVGFENLWCDNENIKYGCKKLALCFEFAEKQNKAQIETLEIALLKWNGGGDLDYPKRVLKHLETGEAERILKL